MSLGEDSRVEIMVNRVSVVILEQKQARLHAAEDALLHSGADACGGACAAVRRNIEEVLQRRQLRRRRRHGHLGCRGGGFCRKP